MRSSTEARLAPWPMRILRPWLLASAAGLSIGTLLLHFDSTAAELDSVDYEPHAAGYGAPSLMADPFAPSASLAAPPHAPSAPLAEFIASPAPMSAADPVAPGSSTAPAHAP